MSDFSEQNSIGYLSDAELADYLEEIGDEDGAQALRAAGARGQSIARMRGAPYANTAHVYGFIEEGDAAAERLPIRPAHSIEADPSLIGKTIKVTLDGFRVAEYPGLGLHTVLFDFQGRDQAGDETQDLQFASVLTVNDEDNAAVNGSPIFTGLTVPADGLSFKVRTITIRSSGDETILAVLRSRAFKDGLKLLGQVQPALPQLVSLAGGIADNLEKRRRNKQVQGFDLGLDFSRSRTSARLRRGSYVVVQVSDTSLWDWDQWFYDPSSMNVVNVEGRIAPLNTIIFAVTDSASGEARSAMREEGRAAAEASLAMRDASA
jgi:hypothetical protein